MLPSVYISIYLIYLRYKLYYSEVFLKEVRRFAFSNLLFKKVLLVYCHMTGSMLPGGRQTGLVTNYAFLLKA